MTQQTPIAMNYHTKKHTGLLWEQNRRWHYTRSIPATQSKAAPPVPSPCHLYLSLIHSVFCNVWSSQRRTEANKNQRTCQVSVSRFKQPVWLLFHITAELLCFCFFSPSLSATIHLKIIFPICWNCSELSCTDALRGINMKCCTTVDSAGSTAFQAGRGLGVTDVRCEQLALLKFTLGLSLSAHTEAHGHFDLQREMSKNEGQ